MNENRSVAGSESSSVNLAPDSNFLPSRDIQSLLQVHQQILQDLQQSQNSESPQSEQQTANQFSNITLSQNRSNRTRSMNGTPLISDDPQIEDMIDEEENSNSNEESFDATSWMWFKNMHAVYKLDI